MQHHGTKRAVYRGVVEHRNLTRDLRDTRSQIPELRAEVWMHSAPLGNC